MCMYVYLVLAKNNNKMNIPIKNIKLIEIHYFRSSIVAEHDNAILIYLYTV